MDLGEFEAIDWDDEDQDDGNLAHCLRHGLNEARVDAVLAGVPVQVQMTLQTAEWAIVGPDASGELWTILFDRSHRRGDWLRPITGWPAKPSESREWRRATGGR